MSAETGPCGAAPDDRALGSNAGRPRLRGFNLADVAIVVALARNGKESGLKAVWRSLDIGVVDFEDFDRNAWTGTDFHVTYLKTAPRYQGKGVARLLLHAVKARIPAHTTKVAFTCVTSKGVARLIEGVFGTLYDYDYHNYDHTNELQLPFRWDSMDELSPQGGLRFSRGPNGYTTWPIGP